MSTVRMRASVALAIASMASAGGLAALAGPAPGGVVVNEVQTRGPAGDRDEFVELRNTSNAPHSVEGWTMWACGMDGSLRHMADLTGDIGPDAFLVAAHRRVDQDAYAAAAAFGGDVKDAGGIVLEDAAGTVVDRVGFSDACADGAPALAKSLSDAAWLAVARVASPASENDRDGFDLAVRTPGAANPGHLEPAETSPPDEHGEPEAGVAGAQATGTLEVRYLEVGQGDAALYEGPCGETGLIDANQGARDEVLAALDAFGSRASLKWINASHYDADHLGDVRAIGEAAGVDVAAVYDRGGSRTVKDSATYRSYYDWLAASPGLRQPVDIGHVFSLCDGAERVQLTVMSQGTDGTAAGGVTVGEENDRGVCVRVEYVLFDLASCGDVNGVNQSPRKDVETPVSSYYGDVDFARVNHHGSQYSSNATYVTTLEAQASVVSVGGNNYGHPSEAVLDRWRAVGDLYQTGAADGTPHDGDVVVTTTGTGTFTVDTTVSQVSETYPIDPHAPSPGPSPAPTPSPTTTPQEELVSSTVVVNEIRTRGPLGSYDQFVELRNVSDGPVNVGGWAIRSCSGLTTYASLRGGTVLTPGQHYLLTTEAGGSPTSRYGGVVAGDQTINVELGDNQGIRLVDGAGLVVDRVGFSPSGGGQCIETAPAPLKSSDTLDAATRSASSDDTGNNSADFVLAWPSPTNRKGETLPRPPLP